MARFTKLLTENDWLNIRNRFENGDMVGDIANDYDIAYNTVKNKAKKEGWGKDKIKEQIQVVKEKIVDIVQSVDTEQLPFVNEQIKKELDHITEITGAINNLQKGALNLHNMILKDTYNRTKSGELTPSEASRIVATQGLTVKDIATMSGISKDKANTNIQINNNEDNELRIKLVE